jgi:hypothetical protein
MSERPVTSEAKERSRSGATHLGRGSCADGHERAGSRGVSDACSKCRTTQMYTYVICHDHKPEGAIVVLRV